MQKCVMDQAAQILLGHTSTISEMRCGGEIAYMYVSVYIRKSVLDKSLNSAPVPI